MKKAVAVLCVLVVAAAIALGVTLAGKNDALTKLDAANKEIEEIKAQASAAAQTAADELAAEKASAEAAARQAAEEADALRTQAGETDRQLAEAKGQMEELSRQLEETIARAEESEKQAAKTAEEFAAYKAQAEEAATQIAKELEDLKAEIAEKERLAEEAAAAEAARAAEEETKQTADAYLLFSNGDWSAAYWNDGSETAIVAKSARITGPGTYTVGLQFPEPSAGLSFAALAVGNGEMAFPGACIQIKAVRVNDREIAFTKGYTASVDGLETRMNIFQRWGGETPEDARSYDGNLEGASGIIVDEADFALVTALEIEFEWIVP